MLVRSIFGLVLAFAVSAQAAESPPVRSARAQASLVTDTDAVAPGVAFHAALRLRLAPGWHTYWRNPGDAGVAPEFVLHLPEGTQAGPIEWPAPVRQPEGPLMTWGYSGEVLLPVAVTVAGGDGLTLRAEARWLVCSNICVPEEASFLLALPAGTPSPSAQAPLFAAAAGAMPRPSPYPAVLDGSVLAVRAPEAVVGAWFAPEEADAIEPAAEQVFARSAEGFTLRLTKGAAFPAGALRGVLVVRDRTGASQALQIAATAGSAPASEPVVPLWRSLLAAVLGGLILNLMPCVFPVLALKAAGIAKMSQAARLHAGRYAASYTAGVLLTFMAVGGALVAARAASGAVGWGFQFQSPLFVAGMAWLLFAMGLNLSGVFLVHGQFTAAGQSLTERGGYVGQFFTGVLAVLVATPCTAPFMGAAVAAALAAPLAETFLIFAAMGLGLASPFLAITLIPGLCRIIPRPGPWMRHFKHAMAFPMYGAAVWMVWVISVQTGSDGVLVVGAGMVLLGFAAWALGARQHDGPRWFLAPAGLAVLAALALLVQLSGAAPMQAQAAEGQEAFSAARLAALRAEGRPVFVNMTAAWCVTCLVNERVALSPKSVREAFAQRRVAYLKGDWTRQDPAITAFLRANGRDGVPLYAVFLPGRAEPEVLPQILTPSVVLHALGIS